LGKQCAGQKTLNKRERDKENNSLKVFEGEKVKIIAE